MLATSAEAGQGIGELLDAINAHARHLGETGAMDKRRRDIVEMRVIKTAEDIIRRDFGAKRDKLSRLMDDVVARKMDPHQAAVKLLAAFDDPEGKD